MDTTQARFVGTWVLVRQESQADDGTVEYPRGEHAAGVIMYDRAGWMSVQLMRTDARVHEYADLNDERTALEGFLAYHGQYTVDTAARQVIHHVAGCSYVGWRGRNLMRGFVFSDDDRVLTLTAATPIAGDTRIRHLIWRRVTGADI